MMSLAVVFTACKDDDKPKGDAPGNAAITGLSANECPADEVTLTATAAHATSFQWRKNGTVIEGETLSTLTVTESGTYTARGINTHGEGNWSIGKEVLIGVCSAPSTPTIEGLSTNNCPATTVTLTATVATAFPAPTFEWRKDGSLISGQTAATLVVSATGSYTVRAVNVVGESDWSTAKAVTIIVCTGPAIVGNWEITSWDFFGVYGSPPATVVWDLEIVQEGNRFVFQDEWMPIFVQMDEDGDFYVEAGSQDNPNLGIDGEGRPFWQTPGGYTDHGAAGAYSMNNGFRIYLEMSTDGQSWALPYQLTFNDGALTLIMGLGVMILEGATRYWVELQGEMNCVLVGKKGAGKTFIPNPKNQNLDGSMLQFHEHKSVGTKK